MIFVEHCDKLRWFTLRYVIARVYGLTNEAQKRYMTKYIGASVLFVYGLTGEVQKRYMTKCIGDMVYFLMTVAELHAVLGHVVVFNEVLAIALNRLESQNPRHRHVADEVEREITRISIFRLRSQRRTVCLDTTEISLLLLALHSVASTER